MFLIRRAKVDDIPTLLKLAKMVHFINLPPDREIIAEKVAWSRNCFLMAASGEVGAAPRKRESPAEHGALAAGIRGITGRSPLFMFVLEEIETRGVIGTSQIISRMGGPGHPNVSLQLSRKEMFSQSLQMGVTHTVAKLYLDESGPTEIGGLILQPSFRGHRLKLGRFISIVRFHFIGLHREFFADRCLAEMMGMISQDGENPFWDYCTRCFINLTYEQADRFCQQSKEFIMTLFPREDIYLTLIAPEARSVVGQVSEETIPARRMLEDLGFKYHQRVDPFDGGPHLEAPMDDIELVRSTGRTRLGEPVKDASSFKHSGIVSTLDDDGEFRAVQTAYEIDRAGKLTLPKDVFALIEGRVGVECGYTPLKGALQAPTPAKPAATAPANGTPTKRARSKKPTKA